MSYNLNESYNKLNEHVSKIIFDKKIKTRVYQNTELALYDITSSLQQFLSHKPQIGVVKNGSSVIDSMNPIWQRNSTPMQIKKLSQHWVEYLEGLDSETNFVVWSSENEITGEILVEDKLAEEIHLILNKKKIFSIQITHRYNQDTILGLYSLIILKPSLFQNTNCVVLMTDKMKANSLIGPFQDLKINDSQIEIIKNNFFLNSDHSIDKIKEYEAKIVDSGQLYFSRFAELTPRLVDRFVFSFKDVNAYAIKSDLSLEDWQACAFSQYNFWYLDLFKNWWDEAENEIFLRGLLVVSYNAIQQNPSLLLMILQSADKIRQMGQWSVEK